MQEKPYLNPDLQQEYMERRVNYGIETYRKSNAMLAFVDKERKPVNDIKFHAKLIRHDFDFGCNIFLLDEFENEEKNKIYREKFKEVFNYATIPFYWKDLEPEEGKLRFDKNSPKIYRRPAPDLCVEYCKENNIKMKGHCLAYEGFAPSWISKERKEYIKQLDKRFRTIAERYGEDINDWDVTNETFNWHPSYSVTPLYRDREYMDICYGLADKYFHFNKKIVNENCGIWYGGNYGFNYFASPFYLQLENMKLKGLKYDALGFQMHQNLDRDKSESFIASKYNPKYVYDVLDTFGTLNKDIQLSEVTIASYSFEKEDMEMQAENLKKMYRIWFSHKNVSSIIYWNMADGYTYNPNGPGVLDMTTGENKFAGGLLMPDLSEKPAFAALRDLVKNEWYTEGDFGCISGTNYATFRGFKGDYELTFIHNGKEYKKTFKLIDTDFDDFACDSTVEIVVD
ncbi:MAG: endo-1,4-beta-xylanase [Clostridia bacterium]|nr:endo-1,4-beta-xylanase [Clostridia bacterium]